MGFPWFLTKYSQFYVQFFLLFFFKVLHSLSLFCVILFPMILVFSIFSHDVNVFSVFLSFCVSHSPWWVERRKRRWTVTLCINSVVLALHAVVLPLCKLHYGYNMTGLYWVPLNETIELSLKRKCISVNTYHPGDSDLFIAFLSWSSAEQCCNMVLHQQCETTGKIQTAGWLGFIF